MKTYEVVMPIEGIFFYDIEASSEEEAIEIATKMFAEKKKPTESMIHRTERTTSHIKMTREEIEEENKAFMEKMGMT